MKTNLPHRSSPRSLHCRSGTRPGLWLPRHLPALLLGLGLFLNPMMRAAVIPGLFNTGVDNAHLPFANRNFDPHYALGTGSPILGTPMTATSAIGFPIPPWLADNSFSTWITPTTNTYGPGATDGSAIYRYETRFDMTGLDPATAAIVGQWATDNYGTDILINGASTGQANTTQYGAWTTFQITKGFVPGTNTLTFVVNNGFQEPTPDGPTGLRVEMAGTASFAPPIPGLFNTGVDNAGTPQADDASEMHYTLAWASAVAGTPSVATSSGGFPIGPWLGDNLVSAWIAPSPTTDGPNATSGAANYFYQTRFDLTGRDPTTAVIEGQWATDNGGIDILINGLSTGQSNPSQFTSWTPFRISRGFVAGLNTLTFMVNNGAGETTASGPTGLRVEMRGRALSSCVDFQNLPVMSVSNPWLYQGIQFFARDFTGGPLSFPGIRHDGAFTGLNCGWQLEMDFSTPCNSVNLTLVSFAAPAIATAYNASGTAVATAVMSGPQNMAETLTLNGLGITRVVIVAPSDETLLLGLCCRRGRPVPPRYDFNDCLLPPGTSFPGAGNVGRIADDGTGRNCVVHLTDANQGGAFGVFSIPSPFGGGNVDNIHMHWRSLVGDDNGSVCTAAQFDRPGADGYSVSWGTGLPNPPSIGNPGEEGAGSGLIVTVDTFDNGGGEAPGLEIKWRGTRVAFDDISPDPGLAKDFLRKNAFVEADLTVDTAGQATFTYDGRVLTATLPGWTGIAGGNIMFGARTGGACDNHWIDDLLIEEGVPVTSCGRNLSVARNGNSVLITWDGGGILQSTPSLAPSSWAAVPGNPDGSYVTSTTGSAQFFRVCCPLAVLSAGGPGVSLPNPTTLLPALPIINRGTAPAENVQVTAITLAGGTLTSPALPANLGTIPANGSVVLNAVFAVGPFVPGGRYALTVVGTYAVGAAIYPFTLAANLVVPPAAPGEALLGTVNVGANQVFGAPYPPQPRRLGPMVNTPAWTVPNGPFVPGTPTPTATGTRMAPLPAPAQAAEIAAAASPGPVVFLANNGLGINNGSTIAEPSGASGGGVVFVSANWFAAFSTDGGNTFTQLDPTTVFPNDAVGFCCDQVVQYVPSINRFIWLLQGTGYRLASASPQDIISSGGTAWTYWNLTQGLFGQCTGFDYPDLSVGNNSLYVSWDAASSGNCRGGFQVARTSLAGLQAGGTITIEFTDPANGTMAWGSHLMQNTLDEIFWVGHNNNSQMRVFSLAEGSNRYFWRDVGVFSWANNAPTSTTPDGQDWLAKNFNGPGGNTFPRNGIIGATRSGNQLWFAWSAGTDRFFQQAHVEMVTLDRGNNFRLIQQVQIWNNSYAFAYPCLATDFCSGEVGLSLEYGGNGNYENHVVGFWGDFLVYITSASNVGTTRYGDYVTIRQAPATQANPGNLFTAFGYGLNSVPPPGTGTTTDIRYVLFGRPASWCITIP